MQRKLGAFFEDRNQFLELRAGDGAGHGHPDGMKQDFALLARLLLHLLGSFAEPLVIEVICSKHLFDEGLQDAPRRFFFCHMAGLFSGYNAGSVVLEDQAGCLGQLAQHIQVLQHAINDASEPGEDSLIDHSTIGSPGLGV